MRFLPYSGPSRIPPVLELNDAGLRWHREDSGGLVITRKPTLRGIAFPFVAFAAMVAFAAVSARDGDGALTALFAFATLLAFPVLLMRVLTRFTMRVDRESVRWDQKRPRPRWGAWARDDVSEVRVREDERHSGEFRATRRVEVRVRGHGWVDFASGKSERRALGLAEDVAAAVGVRFVDARDATAEAGAPQNEAA